MVLRATFKMIINAGVLYLMQMWPGTWRAKFHWKDIKDRKSGNSLCRFISVFQKQWQRIESLLLEKMFEISARSGTKNVSTSISLGLGFFLHYNIVGFKLYLASKMHTFLPGETQWGDLLRIWSIGKKSRVRKIKMLVSESSFSKHLGKVEHLKKLTTKWQLLLLPAAQVLGSLLLIFLAIHSSFGASNTY